MQTAMRSRRHAPDITRFKQEAPMTTSVRQLRGSAVESNTVVKAKPPGNDSQNLLAGRDLNSPIGSGNNRIPPTDSKEYAALQKHYGTQG